MVEFSGLPAGAHSRRVQRVAQDETPSTLHPHQRERERERIWRLRPVQGDFNSTTDRHLFFRDDGRGASEAWQNSTRHTIGDSS